ncbi:renin receptor-like protein domain-containing protein [Phthorimaea operculella]|nr:renin receptor-like protein domain-containing protein [Phthorimaea operculella]
MAVKMVLFWFSVVLSIISVNAEGEFAVLTKPDSLKFAGHDEIRETALKEVYSAALGLSTEERSDWDGLYITNPFKMPEAAVELYVDGVASLGNFEGKSRNYPLLVDEYEPDTFDFIRERIHSRFAGQNNRLVNLRLADSHELKSYEDVFGSVKVNKPSDSSLSHLKTSVEEDLQFLNELEVLKAVTVAVKKMKPDFKIDFFYLRFSSLHPLVDYHGPKSAQAAEAKQLLNDAIIELNQAFKYAYDGSVLFSVVCTDVAHTRRTARAADPAKQEQAQAQSDPIDNADYPAIFNIILWFSVVMIFTLVAITYAVMDMDPGRDSIIYRMTSTRMKKEN